MTTTHNGADVVEHRIGVDGELMLRVQTGQVDIRATDGESARVRDLDGLDLEERFTIERLDGRLVMRPRDRLTFDFGFVRRGRGGGRLAVDLPTTATISVDTASGDVRAFAVRGDQRYRTASGSIDLTDASGTIGIDAVSGSANVRGIGDIDLSGRLVSGDLRLDGGRLRSVALATTSGDLRLRAPLEGAGPYSLETVSGDVEVVAGSQGLRIEGRTLTGQIASNDRRASDSGAGLRALVVGAGGAPLNFKSISGDLRVTASTPAAGGTTSQVPPERPMSPPERPMPPPPAVQPAADDTGTDARL